MTRQEKDYTPEQVKGAEKMCLFLHGIQNQDKQSYLVSVATAYINGIEAGIALERDAQAQTTG